MAEAAALLDRWSQLFASRDAEALAALYTDTALFLGGTPEIRRGRTGVAEYFQSLKVLEAPQVTFTDVAMQPLAAGVIDMAFVATFSFGGAAIPGRITWTLVDDGGDWRIACHHASPMPQLQA